MEMKTLKDWDEGKVKDPVAATYSTEQAPGAYPNGTRVRKVRSKPADGHQDGALATVLGSWGPLPAGRITGVCEDTGWPEDTPVYGYFVEWDSHKGIPVFVTGNRVDLVSGPVA